MCVTIFFKKNKRFILWYYECLYELPDKSPKVQAIRLIYRSILPFLEWAGWHSPFLFCSVKDVDRLFNWVISLLSSE